MSVLGIVFLVSFVVICAFLVLLILVQDDGNSGMGGLLGGRGTAAFGSHSANILTKATGIFVTLFFAVAFILALINKKPRMPEDLAPTTAVEGSQKATESGSADEKSNWWMQSEKDETPAETTIVPMTPLEPASEAETPEQAPAEESQPVEATETAGQTEENAPVETAAPSEEPAAEQTETPEQAE